MRVRHKQPTLVSMWMLDVFCCALGCVTLLFLLNSRMAGDEAQKNKAALVDLAGVRKQLVAALTDLDTTKLRLNSDIQQLTTQLAAVKTEKDQPGASARHRSRRGQVGPGPPRFHQDRAQCRRGQDRRHREGTRHRRQQECRCRRSPAQEAEGNRHPGQEAHRLRHRVG